MSAGHLSGEVYNPRTRNIRDKELDTESTKKRRITESIHQILSILWSMLRSKDMPLKSGGIYKELQ